MEGLLWLDWYKIKLEIKTAMNKYKHISSDIKKEIPRPYSRSKRSQVSLASSPFPINFIPNYETSTIA